LNGGLVDNYGLASVQIAGTNFSYSGAESGDWSLSNLEIGKTYFVETRDVAGNSVGSNFKIVEEGEELKLLEGDLAVPILSAVDYDKSLRELKLSFDEAVRRDVEVAINGESQVVDMFRIKL